MREVRRIVFPLLQMALGQKTSLPYVLSDEEWQMVHRWAQKQALVGVLFAAVEQLPEEQCPPADMVGDWYAEVMEVERRNTEMMGQCAEVCRGLSEDGFEACVLKGQSLLRYYPERLGMRRMSGDIDVLVWPKEMADTTIKPVVEYCLRKNPRQKVVYHHAELPTMGKTEVEAHIRMSYLCSWRRNRRLQKWTREVMRNKVDSSGEFPVLRPEEDAVYQLLHIYKHLFEGGIGMRQMVDYAMLLVAERERLAANRESITSALRSFGMKRFVASVMWLMREVCALPEECLLCAADEEEGRFLLDDMMQAGNFGHYDTRYVHHNQGAGAKEKMLHAWVKTVHNMRLLSHYPEETLAEPCFRLRHAIWRRLRLWRWE